MSNSKNNDIVIFDIKNYSIITYPEAICSNFRISEFFGMTDWIFLKFQEGSSYMGFYGGVKFFISFSALRV